MIDMAFDLGSTRKITGYSNRSAKLANEVITTQENYDTLCIFITTHTDDDTGNPFIGYGREKGYVAASVVEVRSPEIICLILCTSYSLVHGCSAPTVA